VRQARHYVDKVGRPYTPPKVQLPSIGAGVVAIFAGWIIDDMLQPLLGMGLTLLVSFAGSTVIFFVARKWLRELRDG
jgi:uncharacterized membrane protein YdjX (TVP38/TMEM64 family)